MADLFAEAELDAGGLLPVGGEASHVVQLGDEVATVPDEEREGPAGLDRRRSGRSLRSAAPWRRLSWRR